MGVVFVSFDIFPAQVVTPMRTWRDARVAVADRVLKVWVSDTGVRDSGPGPHMVFEGVVAEQAGNLSKERTLTLDNGIKVRVIPQAGCGCGNPLRSWNPWPGQRKVYRPVDGV